MGTFQLGRVGIENTTGEVHGWSSGGSGVKISGRTAYGSVPEALVVREQLLGYVEQADEDFVPVVWSEQPEVNGFYRVRSVDVDSNADDAPFGVLDWSVDLERVQGFAAPLVEVTQLGLPREDSVGWDSFQRGYAIPAAARSALETYRVAGALNRTSGGMFVRPGRYGDALVDAAQSNSSIVSFYVDPELFYDAASTLRVGDPLRVAVGRQAANEFDAWSVSNGLLEIEPSFDTNFTLRYRMWLGSAWSVWETATFAYGLSEIPLAAPHTITVLRNSPEEVAVRLLSSTGRNPVAIDLSLRRGARYVSVTFAQATGIAPVVQFSNFASPGDIDPGGWSKTVSGVTKFCASKIPTNSPPNFQPITLPVKIWTFCFGLTDGVNRDGYVDDGAYSTNEWAWAGSEKQSVVAQ